MLADNGSLPLAAHVSPDRLREFPLMLGATTTENPFQRIIPAITAGPDAFYALNAYLGIEPGWVFRRAGDLRSIYKNTGHFSSKNLAPFAKLLGEDWYQIPVETDPPQHTAYRALLSPLLAPQKMAALENKVRMHARRYIDKFRDNGGCEFMGEFAFEFPIAVFLELMGLPQSDVKQLLSWEKQLIHEPDMSRIAAATRAVKQYLLQKVAERRRDPQDDLLGFAATARLDGRLLTENEIVGLTFGLYLGGLDTVSSNMGLHFRHLAEASADQRHLRERPADVPIAVEELLRAYAAVTTWRTCISEIEIAGVTIKPGDRVAVSTTLAGRDESKYERPHEVLFDRRPNHESFADGPHRCVGMHLARREMHIGMTEFLKAIPEFRIATGASITTALGGVIQPLTLPLVW
jgi:cytochrome P450